MKPEAVLCADLWSWEVGRAAFCDRTRASICAFSDCKRPVNCRQLVNTSLHRLNLLSTPAEVLCSHVGCMCIRGAQTHDLNQRHSCFFLASTATHMIFIRIHTPKKPATIMAKTPVTYHAVWTPTTVEASGQLLSERASSGKKSIPSDAVCLRGEKLQGKASNGELRRDLIFAYLRKRHQRFFPARAQLGNSPYLSYIGRAGRLSCSR